jgi:sigma-B regulation protein RsbQ
LAQTSLIPSALVRNNVTFGGEPDGPPVLFAHGFGCDQSVWRSVEPAFAHDHLTVRFDHVGSGGSDLSAYSSERYATLEGYADDVIELCRELDRGPATYVGHSAGASIGIIAAARAPELFDRLVLISPSASFVDDGDYTGGFSRGDIDDLLAALDSNHLGWATATAPMIMGTPARPDLTDELTTSFCRLQPDVALDFARAAFLGDVRAELPRVTTPTLIIQSRDDALVPAAAAHHLHEAIAGSRLAWVDATGHCPHMSAPEQTVAAMRELL